jgi:hypothetical protein
MQLHSVGVPCSWHLNFLRSFCISALYSHTHLHALLYQELLARTLNLSDITRLPRLFFEIFVEPSMTPKLSYFVCLQNQHHIHNAQVYYLVSCAGLLKKMLQ